MTIKTVKDWQGKEIQVVEYMQNEEDSAGDEEYLDIGQVNFEQLTTLENCYY